MKRDQSIQKKLFSTNFILILIIVLLFMAISFFYSLNVISDNSSQSIKQTAASIKNELELELDKANNLQKRILFSERFNEVLFAEREKYQDDVESLMLQRELNKLSDTVCGPDEYRSFQMNYWNSNGGCAGVGYNPFVYYDSEAIKDIHSVEKIVNNKGKKSLSAPFETKWAKNSVKVISMYRSMRKTGSEDYVIIETQLNYQTICDTVEKNLITAGEEQGGYSVLILNNEDEVIYASKEIENNVSDYAKTVSDYKLDGEINYGKKEADNKPQVFAGIKSKALNWKIWIMEDHNMYMKPFGKMAAILMVIAAAVILILWVVTYTLTKEFLKPIFKIHQKMKGLDFDQLEKADMEETGGNIKELKELDSSFNKMCLQLKDSREKLHIAYENEIQANFLAMQAQMNPHFLYNILSIIKIMGKEVNSQSIVDICTELSMMLRYISTSNQGPVTIQQEERHSLNYLKLMKTRFQDRLEYKIDIPSDIGAIPVPRLILQPLVENSIKYATEGRPPWKVQISGWREENKWFLSVKDNGPGIQNQEMRDLEEKLNNAMISRHSEVTEIGGMGLLNIYSRLMLAYGDDSYFQLRNLGEGGLEVIIGGKTGE